MQLIKRISINLPSSQINFFDYIGICVTEYIQCIVHWSSALTSSWVPAGHFHKCTGKPVHVWNHSCSQDKEKIRPPGRKCSLLRTGTARADRPGPRLGRFQVGQKDGDPADSGQLIPVSDHTHSKRVFFVRLSNHSFSNRNTTWLIKCSSLLKLSFFLWNLSCLQYT